jgi:hypothetical protein
MEPATPAQPQKELEYLRPAIAGGLFLGLLSSLPFLAFGNCLCGLWIQGGGAIATWLLNKQRPGGLKYGDGALAGVLSSLAGTIVWTAVNIPIQAFFFTPEAAAQMRELMEQYRAWLPPDFETSMAPLLEPGFNLSRLLTGVITFSLVSGLFAMIGGILMVALLNRPRGRGIKPADGDKGTF